VALSQHNQEAIRERFPKVRLLSGMGSSESGSVGTGDIDTKGDGFMVLKPRADLAVIVDGVRFAQAGEQGIFSRTGHIACGYWRDPDKTREVFVTVDGRRWILTGDRAKLEPDGLIRLYGRDSSSINTGGEKVFAEEVEGAVRSHPAVIDAVVIGIPDPRWGQAVAAVVALRHDATLDVKELRDFCSVKLSRYKLPRSIFVAPEIRRSPSGKADLRWAKAFAADAMAANA
jgi:fatty-acyl-CoA synthase